MDPRDAAALEDLADLRRRRERRGRDPGLGDVLDRMQREARRTRSRLGELVELWRTVIPAELVGRSRIDALRGGTLHVTVDGAATAYALDRHLRGGGTADLRRGYRGALVRVRVKVGPLDPRSADDDDPRRRPRDPR